MLMHFHKEVCAEAGGWVCLFVGRANGCYNSQNVFITLPPLKKLPKAALIGRSIAYSLYVIVDKEFSPLKLAKC